MQMILYLRSLSGPLCLSGAPLSYWSFGSLVSSLKVRSHQVWEMKITRSRFLPGASALGTYSTSRPSASAASRHALTDLKMRPCALNARHGETSIGVVIGNSGAAAAPRRRSSPPAHALENSL